jgi:protein involved in polysaccharide export with SLBB domain
MVNAMERRDRGVLEQGFRALACLIAVIFASLALSFGTAGAFAQTVATASPPAVPVAPAPVAAVPRFDLAGFVLSVGDRVSVRVAGEDSLTTETMVGPAGLIDVALIGPIPAANQTVAAVQDAIAAALRDGYLNNPQVSLNVLTLMPVTVIGEVQSPGEIAYRGDLTVLNLVSAAGGFTTMANQTRVAIRAAGETTAVEYPLNATTIVAPGDEVRFLKSAFYILGEVNNPGEYRLTEGLTVMAAVATARGFTTRANQTRVLIQRAGEAEERAYRLTPDLRVQSGDTLRIAERYF